MPTTVGARPPSTTTPAAADHRTDLDGLRGIAIALVACFHIWFGRVSGGVDVFLTLSGYFFVGSLLRHTITSQAATVSLRRTVDPIPRLRRLARRLLPALFTVLIAVLVLTVVIFPQTRWVNIGHELTASALYYQNWYLALNSQDYLAASSANSPLQHIWSMSVQGQFFVATLLSALTLAGLLKLIARTTSTPASERTIRIIVGTAIFIIAAASFAWAQMRMGVNQPWNYYDTLARLWEPLAGGLLAIWTPRMYVPRAIRGLAAAVALALIITCGFWIDGVDSYPGPWALVPVGSTLVIIWAGANASPHSPRRGRHSRVDESPPVTNHLLSGALPIWLGGIAYSLYLWHWPLLIFYLNARDQDSVSFVEGLGLLAVSIALAWMTKRYIEDPLRSGTRPAAPRRAGSRGVSDSTPSLTTRWGYPAVVTTILVALVASSAVGIGLWQRHVSTIEVNTAELDPALYPGARALLNHMPVPAVAPQPSPLEVLEDFPETSTDGFMSNFTDPEIHVGVYGNPQSSRTIALAGGSHSEMWITALNELGKRHDFKVTTYLKMGCPLSTEESPKLTSGAPYPQCREWVDRVIPAIIAAKPDAVFTTSTRPRDGAPGDWLPPTYVDVFDQFTSAGIPVVGIRDTPWPHNAHGDIDTPACLADGGTADSCGTARATALDPVDPAAALAQSNPLFHQIDLSDGVCTSDFCPAIIGNIIVYKDWHHLSATYVRSMTDALGERLVGALDWLAAGR